MITWSKEIEVTPKNCKDYFADNAWLCYRISFNRNHSFYKIVDFPVLKLATESKKKNATANKLYIFMQWILLSHWVLSIYTNKISSRGELYMFGWTSIRGRLLLTAFAEGNTFLTIRSKCASLNNANAKWYEAMHGSWSVNWIWTPLIGDHQGV